VYKIFFVDLDGTLLNGDSKISKKNRRAVADAFRAGKQVVLCSGRAWMSMARFEKSLGMERPDRYGVSFNGGIVYEVAGRKFLFEDYMENEAGQEAANTLRELGADVLMYAGGRLYAENKTDAILAYKRRIKIPVEYVENFSQIFGNITKLLAVGGNEKLSEINENIGPALSPRYGVVFSSENMLEILPKGTNKGSGMMFLAGRLGIEREEIIAAGDQANDIEMLERAGLGVAVANATPEAKAAADVTLSLTNDEDAAEHIIREWLLK